MKNTFVFNEKILYLSDFVYQINSMTSSQSLKSMEISYDPIINFSPLHSNLSISWFTKSPNSKNFTPYFSFINHLKYCR